MTPKKPEHMILEVDRRQVLVGSAAAAATVAGLGKAHAAGLFSDKVVLVTGATEGLGRAVAMAFAEEGATVYFCGLGAPAGHELVGEIEAAGGSAAFIEADVRNDDDIRRMAEAITANEGRLDIAVNNAAILGAHEEPGNQTVATWTDVMATNAFGVHRSMHHEAPLMTDGGVIINIGSTGASDPGPGSAAYTASKAAIHTMTQGAARDLGVRGIRVLALMPGKMQGGMTELRFLQAGLSAEDYPNRPAMAEVAQDILWLATNDAGDAHGQILSREEVAQIRTD